MSIDTTQLLQMVAGLADDIESEHPDAELGTFAVVVEIGDEGDDDDPGWTRISYRCNDARRWVQKGLFGAAREAVDASHPPVEDEAEDDE